VSINSREKGKRGERQFRDELRGYGYAARRGQQFSGSPDSPDVVCDALWWIHFEVKFVENLNIYTAMAQAKRDCGGKVPVVAHRRNFSPWLITMEADWLFASATGLLGGLCHFSTLQGKRLNLRDAVESARREAGERIPFLVHERNGMRLVTMECATFFRLLRGDGIGISGAALAKIAKGSEVPANSSAAAPHFQ
jgi:hypothetical protein